MAMAGSQAPAQASISDTLLEFARPVLAQLQQGASHDLLKQTLEMVITVWNAHVMALPAWGHPEHLEGLMQLVAVSRAPHLAQTLEVLSARRNECFASDARVVSRWDLVIDDQGRTRFDCTARLPKAWSDEA